MGLTRTAVRLGAWAAPGGLPVLRRLIRARLGGVFGDVPYSPARAPGDPGLHGPGSATWQVIGDPAAIVGGVRGLLVQVLHPLAMAGVADHSAFERDPLGRLQRTAGYVTVTAFGALDEVLEAASFVRRRHVPVVGDAPDGRAYRAEDPTLLAWVSIALTESFLATDAAFAARPVRGAQADAFVYEQSRLAALLDPRVDLKAIAGDPASRRALRAGSLRLPMLDGGTLPTTVAGLRERMAAFEPELQLSEQGHRAMAFLRRPPLEPAVALAYRPIVEGALATVPRERRRACGWRADPLTDRAALATTFGLVNGLRLGAGRSGSVQVAEARVAAGEPAGTGSESRWDDADAVA